jgi:hypothetical protein
VQSCGRLFWGLTPSTITKLPVRVYASVALVVAVTALSSPQPGFTWGWEGHEVIALVAEHYMTATAKARL